MKKIKYLSIIIILTICFISCNEDEWLREDPIDFYAPENSYNTTEQFNAAVARLYEATDNAIMWSAQRGNYIYSYVSDMTHGNRPWHNLNPVLDNLIPENGAVSRLWGNYFRIIFDANVIIGRIDGENTEFTSEVVRNTLKAEAMFFRAYMYRILGIQFGGVPIVLDEISEPRRDFVRSSQEQVFSQCISDLEFAAANLPSVNELSEEGRLTKAAANQLLAEIFVINEDWDNAISAASAVINSGNYALMTERFGSRKDEPGDVYWDLFRRENQNRSSGNMESIWVAQYEYQVDGGGIGSNLVRFAVPLYWIIKDNNGTNVFFSHSTQNGGRGIGWITPNDYFRHTVWELDPNDMRNSEHNIIRDVLVDNPESEWYGQMLVASGAMSDYFNNVDKFWSPIFTKTTPINNFPDEAMANPETGETNTFANMTYRDHYYMRLAETYLLRAEAYLGKGDQTNAAADINVVRARVNATQVAPGDVDIDFILDERARELCYEELRMLTLQRLGVLPERMRIYDDFFNGKWGDNLIGDHQNLWPIPQSEIERNTEAVLEQNPGY